MSAAESTLLNLPAPGRSRAVLTIEIDPVEHARRQAAELAAVTDGGVCAALDLVVAAGISRVVGPGWGLVVFVALAVAATVCSDWILQRATRPRRARTIYDDN